MVDAFISGVASAGALAGSELVEVSELSSTATITAATISAAAADNSFNDSANGFVAAGFAVGHRVKVTGFTGDVANNIFAATVTALTAGKMTIGGADGNVIVDDAAGESVTISRWVSRRTNAAVLGHQLRGARVRMTADDAAINLTTEPAVTFDEAQFDTDGFWTGGSGTRLTIPTGLGITHVELCAAAHVSSTTGDTWCSLTIFHYNSGGALQRQVGPSHIEHGSAIWMLNAATGPIEVADGDYFQLRPREESDASVTLEGNETRETYMSLKVVGMEPV